MHRILLLILLSTSLFAREYIAIIDFEGIGVSTDDAKTLTQRLTSEMIALEVYQVLERSEMKRLLEEQKFQYSGCVDLKCAVEVGKLLGAKYMVVGNISKLGNAFSVDSRLISVESGESYVSAKYTLQGNIESLLIDGMTSIAHQLCELPYTAKEKNTQDVTLTNSTSNVARKDSTYKFWSSFYPVVGFNVYIPNEQYFGGASVNDYNYGVRWDSPIKIINKKAQLVLKIKYYQRMSRSHISIINVGYISLGTHLSIFPIPSVEVRPGIANHNFFVNPVQYVTGRVEGSTNFTVLHLDADYHLPIHFFKIKPIINLGMHTDGSYATSYLGLYLRR